MYLIDTNVLSELRKGRRGHSGFFRWSSSIEKSELYISVLVLGEIRRGIQKKRSKDPAQADVLESWLARVKIDFAIRTIGITPEIVDRWGSFRIAASNSQIDGLMAATAEAHGLVFVTRNVKDVAYSDAKILNPFDA
jgi:toxin FitB